MSQPKLTERIARLEDAILEIKTIIEQKDNLGDLIAQLKRSKTVTAPVPPPAEDVPAPAEDVPAPAEDVPAPAEDVPAPAPVPAPAQVVEDVPASPVEPTPIAFHAPALPSKPSLVMVLSSLSPSSTSNEQKLIKRFKKYIDDFLEENQTADGGVTMDYRLLALTMEFVSAAEKEIKYLTNSKETTRGMSVATVIWLLQAYQEYNTKAALALPPNLALLIHTVYDMLLSTQYMIKAPDAPAPAPAPKKSKWGLHWNTLKKRWTQRKEPAQ